MINDVKPLLMDVGGCAVRWSGFSETPGHRSQRHCELFLRQINYIKLLVYNLMTFIRLIHRFSEGRLSLGAEISKSRFAR